MTFLFLCLLCLLFRPAAADDNPMAQRIRYPVAAGGYYTQHPKELTRIVSQKLSDAKRRLIPDTGPAPKAVIVPAGPLFFTSDVAAAAYAPLMRLKPFIKRVVLIGATTEKYFGAALSEAEYWDIPGARFKIDKALNKRLAEIPGIGFNEIQHEKETGLEVQLPFIHAVFSQDVTLTPVLIGDANIDQITDIFEVVWGGPETIVIVATDLSDGFPLKVAEKQDADTARKIENRDCTHLTTQNVTAPLPTAGLLRFSQNHALNIRRLALSTSASRFGDEADVTGFGAWGLYETEQNDEEIKKELESTIRAHQETLLKLAAKSILYGFRHGRALKVKESDYPPELRQNGAVFVHLYYNGMLRGSIGSQDANESLVKNIAENAYNAAFQDFRYAQLEISELKDIEISISFLMPKKLLKFTTESELVRQLRPNIDGLLLRERANSGFFLPSVWDIYPKADDFLAQLKRKAGLPPDYTSATLKIYRFEVLDISSGDLENPASVWK